MNSTDSSRQSENLHYSSPGVSWTVVLEHSVALSESVSTYPLSVNGMVPLQAIYQQTPESCQSLWDLVIQPVVTKHLSPRSLTSRSANPRWYFSGRLLSLLFFPDLWQLHWNLNTLKRKQDYASGISELDGNGYWFNPRPPDKSA